MKCFTSFIQGVMVGFDWDWDFKVIEINLFIVNFTIIYGKTEHDDFLKKLCERD